MEIAGETAFFEEDRKKITKIFFKMTQREILIFHLMVNGDNTV